MPLVRKQTSVMKGAVSLLIQNVKVYTEDRHFVSGEIGISHGRFTNAVPAGPDEDVIDGQGAYAIPGLIDMHLHGCMGHDFSDGTFTAIEEITACEAQAGVTAILPATMTLPDTELLRILETAAKYRRVYGSDPFRADLIGINMEGPFISRDKKGAQDPAYIRPCDAELGRWFLEASEGLVKFIGIAPEENENAEDFIREMKKETAISIAHSNADYETALQAFRAGASHVVHLYNAMSAFSHREPGIPGAVFECDHVTAELICDGVHVHPAVIRSTLRMMGPERVIFVSDSMRAAGLADGIYTLGGQDVLVTGNRAVLAADGALAGSVTNLMDCMVRTVKEMGIPLETAVACATVNPAKAAGAYDQYGSISAGKKANVVLLNEDLHIILVIKDGVIIRG